MWVMLWVAAMYNVLAILSMADMLQLQTARAQISVGILSYTFIHSCSSNTYPIILLLEACISQIYVLRYTT